MLVQGPGKDVVGAHPLLDGLDSLRAGPVLLYEEVNCTVLPSLKALSPSAFGYTAVLRNKVLNLN